MVPIGLPTFSNEATFTFSAHLTTWTQINFDLDMWTLIVSTNEGSHFASMTQLWLKYIMWKVEPNVNLFSQQQQATTDNRQQQWTNRSLCVFPAKAGDTKIMVGENTPFCSDWVFFEKNGGEKTPILYFLVLFKNILRKNNNFPTNWPNLRISSCGQCTNCLFWPYLLIFTLKSDPLVRHITEVCTWYIRASLHPSFC